MGKCDLLRNLGWSDDLVAAFERGLVDDIELTEVELDLEPPTHSSSEIFLHLDAPILQTNPIA